MNKGPVLIVDEDPDDWEFLRAAWNDLKFENELLFFNYAEDVLEYLYKAQITPFLILSDVNLPKMDGFELREKILKSEEIKYKSIPFIFWSTFVSNEQVKKAYDLGGHGFFLKGNTFDEIKDSLIEIVRYWVRSQVPT